MLFSVRRNLSDPRRKLTPAFTLSTAASLDHSAEEHSSSSHRFKLPNRMKSLQAYIMHHAGAKTALFLSMLAGDGNPVRHSLVNLVLQEDLPMLMEAMTEECNVSFEDFSDETTASTSSIIHPHNERKERRQRRNVDRICFVEEPPQVFAYLDEKSCEVDEDDLWQQGEHITYDRYQKLVEATTEEQLQAQLELSRWHQSIQKQAPVESQSPNSNEFALGVTSKLSYGGLQSFNQPIAIASNDINTSSI
ncbi:hypothetical protein L596_015253 [Steinernema carpocapsae]|uniref:Uncharacterized protein n=1 Tax=Steinernema carpocapsae TaxID=34508 RepID=A0A4V6A335_STECR|nr:hypothetical protein L596_015253 [Steinernema carpocapsae]